MFLFGVVIEGARGNKSMFTKFIKRIDEGTPGFTKNFLKKPVSWLKKDTEEENY